MKIENHSDPLVYWFHHKTHLLPKERKGSLMKSYHIQCPKCNNDHSFYRYGKDPDGYQKYLCRTCQHQFAPDRLRSEGANCRRKHPPCPVCGKASFLHHDYEHYSNYRCADKKCNHSFFVWKSAAVTAPSMSNLFGKHDFKYMRYSALNGLTPAQVAGLNLSKQRKREFLLVAWSFPMISWAVFSFLLYSAEFKIQPVSR